MTGTNAEQWVWSKPVSQGGRSEHVVGLREAIARIEGDGSILARFADVEGAQGARNTLGAGNRMGTRNRAAAGNIVPLGRALALDRALRGGLARGALHEVVAAAAGDAAAASGFALALAARLAAASDRHPRTAAAPIVWILEDAARAESGAPYAPGLRAHGIDPARLIVVAAASGRDGLWAMEEALKVRAGAVVAELWRTKAYDLVASRRLVLAAARGGTPGILVPAGAPGTAQALSSAARTRFEVAAAPGPEPGGPRLPLPGPAAWTVRLARIRAGPGGIALDREKLWPLVWDHEEALFRDALPLPSPADAVDRPPPSAAAGRRAA